MEIKEIQIKLKELNKKLYDLRRSLDLDQKQNELNQLESQMQSTDFWNDIDMANKISSQVNYLKKEINQTAQISSNLMTANEILDLLNLDNDEELKKELDDLVLKLIKDIDDLEINVLLNQENDKLNCFLEIHPGAGGTESCDWAEMLLRMYLKFCEKNNYKYEIIDEQKGEEAGIKSVTVLIKGFCAYGYFKCEKGVHRLVRISPFDSNSRRHTSFASVTITPEFNNDINLEINEKDLKIDVYRSSGKGGQGVNTTDSAVRITHLPTKIVVTCQNERSQIKNKETAMKVLKSKLYQLELEKQEQELNKIKGINSNIDFGSQIRSYVLEPYTLVKDSRTNYETAQADKVLDGDIMPFILAMLKNKIS
ncbi:MAG TPA: peptide chain release factor 2 [Bacilli bacterium]|nr:peptide chain release factor 2 [Bacilli bacterium]